MKIPGLKMEKLEKLIKAVKANPPMVNVGVFDPSQSAKAAAHEFGTSTLPKRSFLKEPLQEQMSSYLNRAKVFDKDALAKTLKAGSLLEYGELVGQIALNVVHDAFSSGGFGKWPAKHEPGPILVDTGALRDSVSVQVKEG